MPGWGARWRGAAHDSLGGTVTAEGGDFGALLARHREDRGWTQEELADRSGVDAKTIGALETDAHRAPHQRTLRRLREALALGDDEGRALLAAARRRRERRKRRRTVAGVPPPVSPPLPTWLATPIVGRERERGEVTTRLRGGTRLLVLVGPGGIGKSRVARAVAADLAGDFGGDVRIVEFAPLAATLPAMSGAGDQALEALAAVLGIRAADLRSPTTLAVRLHDVRALLVLENLEVVAALGPVLGDLLAAAPHLAMLTTSRVATGLGDAGEYAIGPLLPGPATALFVERARALVGSDPAATEPAEVEAICARLGGLPLAIALAAAQTRRFRVAALRDHLASRLPALGGGPFTSPARQRTMRATFDWSYHLLGPGEQAVFRHLSIFAAGASPDMVGAICGAVGGPGLDVAASLEALVDAYLALEERPGDDMAPRFGLGPLLRDYATDLLCAGGEFRPALDRHAEYHIALVEEAARGEVPLDLQDWDRGDGLAALGWVIIADDAARAGYLADALWRYRLRYGTFPCAPHRLSILLDHTGKDPAGQAWAHYHLSVALAEDGRDKAAAGELAVALARAPRPVAREIVAAERARRAGEASTASP